jgi:DNA-directed RNA polymerase subunit H (RpoH/RPB5)
MHILQPKHTKLNEKEASELLKRYNIAKSQLPKILLSDSALPPGCNVGDVIKIERAEEDRVNLFFRVVI